VSRTIIYIDNFLVGHGYTPTIGAYVSELLRKEGYSVITTSDKKNELKRLWDMLLTIYKHRNRSVALITTYSGKAFYFAWLCALWCRILRVPYVPCLHGGNLPTRINNSPALSRQLFGKSFTNVAVSGYLANPLQQRGWKVMIIPNNIHLSTYPFLQRTSCNGHMLWVRSFHEIYNPTLAIQLLHELRKTNPDARLTMVGPDKDGSLATCKELAATLNVDAYVAFKGLLPRDEWIQLSASHDVFINTTNFDNLPVSVIEALALGLPVVSSNVGGVPFLIEDNIDGLLTEAGNLTSFTTAVQRLQNDDVLVQQLSIHARKKAERYDWQAIKIQWHELLQNI